MYFDYQQSLTKFKGREYEICFKILRQLKNFLICFFQEEMGFVVLTHLILSVDLMKIVGLDHKELNICLIIANS